MNAVRGAIYHLVWRSDWVRCAGPEGYRPDSLAREGFIHCTKEADRVTAIADAFFPDRAGEELLLVTIDEAAIDVPVRYEDPGVGHLFPHVYGPLPLASVVAIRPMIRQANRWLLPAETNPSADSAQYH